MIQKIHPYLLTAITQASPCGDFSVSDGDIHSPGSQEHLLSQHWHFRAGEDTAEAVTTNSGSQIFLILRLKNLSFIVDELGVLVTWW